jgi:hypothetical protein
MGINIIKKLNFIIKFHISNFWTCSLFEQFQFPIATRAVILCYQTMHTLIFNYSHFLFASQFSPFQSKPIFIVHFIHFFHFYCPQIIHCLVHSFVPLFKTIKKYFLNLIHLIHLMIFFLILKFHLKIFHHLILEPYLSLNSIIKVYNILLQ